VQLYVGDLSKSLPRIIEDVSPAEELYILARSNSEIESIRKADLNCTEDVWSEFERSDSARSRFYEDILTAVELARRDMLTQALRRLKRSLRIFRSNGAIRKPFRLSSSNAKIEDVTKRAIAVDVLVSILSVYDSLLEKTVLDVYRIISDTLGRSIEGLSLQRITAGRIKSFAESRKHSELVHSVKLPASEKRAIRTIHQAKSAEFHNVLVVLDHMKPKNAVPQLSYMLRPSEYANSEEKRILYVALSRAKNRLLVSVPELNTDDETVLQEFGIDIIRR